MEDRVRHAITPIGSVVSKPLGIALISAFGWLTVAASPTSGQTIAREYIYAGNRLLAYQASFADVLPDNPIYRFVNIIANRGITGGCGGANFCPNASVTRDAMALFLLKSKEAPGYQPPACTTPMFADVPASNPFCPWIEELARRGVVGGCGGGNYCPTAAVTREQVSVFLLRTLDPNLNPPACVPPNLFTDVQETSGFCRWIEELVNRQIATGCGDHLYCPTAEVSRGTMAVFLVQTFGLQ